MNKKLKDRTADKIRETTAYTNHLVNLAKKKYNESTAKERITKTTHEVKGFMDDKGITDAANKVASTVDEHLDTLSGQRLLQLVEERLSLQSHYNDVLAAKLDEALTRISELEEALKAQNRQHNKA